MSELKELTKELCNKSGCHHKCNDTTDCVVEDEALLLINENKSNKFEVKSNNELFKQALVEGVSRHFDKIIEQEKQIEEIIIDLLANFDEMGFVPTTPCPDPEAYAIEWKEKLTKALKGYRKQSEDTVEVVRCKYCKYYNENEFTYEGDGYGRCDHPQQAFECECYDMWVETTPDDYCSYGEMKGGA